MTYSYTIKPEMDLKAFLQACEKIRKKFPNAQTDGIVTDILDGSHYEKFDIDSDCIRVYDDFDVGAVFVESTVRLNDLFEKEFIDD